MLNDTCPLCNGTGKNPRIKPIRREIKRLRAQGLTVRQIAKAVGKGSTTVHYHLTSK